MEYKARHQIGYPLVGLAAFFGLVMGSIDLLLASIVAALMLK